MQSQDNQPHNNDDEGRPVTTPATSWRSEGLPRKYPDLPDWDKPDADGNWLGNGNPV